MSSWRRDQISGSLEMSCRSRTYGEPSRTSGMIFERRAMLLGEGDVIEARHLGPETRVASDEPATTRLDEVERGLIRRVLGECGGNVSQAARRLGVSRELLRYRMRKHGLR